VEFQGGSTFGKESIAHAGIFMNM